MGGGVVGELGHHVASVDLAAMGTGCLRRLVVGVVDGACLAGGGRGR